MREKTLSNKLNGFYITVITLFVTLIVVFTSALTNSEFIKFIYRSNAQVEHSWNSPYIVSEKDLKLSINGIPYESEITPMVQFYNNKFLYIISTAWTFVCYSDKSLAQDSNISIERNKCKMLIKPDTVYSVDSTGIPRYQQPNLPSNLLPLTYIGVTGAGLISNSETGNTELFTVSSAEHQNVSIDNLNFQNSIYPEVRVENCKAGYLNNVWNNCWESFSSFALANSFSLNISDTISITRKNIGPVAWPHNGYKTSSNSRINSGPYHTTLFIDNDFAYVYFVANNARNPNDIQKRRQSKCISVVRAPITEVDNLSSWRVYYNGNFENKSLPNGISYANLFEYFSVNGGETDCINLSGSTIYDSHLYFNVAKIKGTNMYIGAHEHELSRRVWNVNVRFSEDLVNWSKPYTVSESSDLWGSGKYSYPTFLSKDGKSNSIIDADEFYIIGKEANNAVGYKLNSMKINLNKNKEDLDIYEELVKQYYKVFLGWEADITNPFYTEGMRWHIDQLRNNGVAVAVKNFINSDEYKKANKSNEEFIKDVYLAILSRVPDKRPTGSNYWKTNLDNGQFNRDEIIDEISKGWEVNCVIENKSTLRYNRGVCYYSPQN